MSTATLEKSLTIMVPIENVFPNPKNPRKNDGIDSLTLQNIITDNGWETPVTAYETEEGSGMYVLLGGHRRLFAAKQAEIPEIPVFVRPKPQSSQEEMKRIGGLQSGFVNWSQYELASYTYNLWVEWGKPARKAFAKKLALSQNQVTDYINVLEYFPRTEIEDGLTKKELTITALAALVKWMRALKEYKRGLVQGLGEDMIRNIMIQKVIDKKASRDVLRNTEYCKTATADDIKRFFTDKNMVLDEQIGALGIEKKYKDFNGHMISFGHLKNRIPEIKPETEHQKEAAIGTLEDTIKALQAKLEEIKAK